MYRYYSVYKPTSNLGASPSTNDSSIIGFFLKKKSNIPIHVQWIFHEHPDWLINVGLDQHGHHLWAHGHTNVQAV